MGLVLMALINWLLKLKMHANTYFFFKFYFIWKYDMKYFFYIFERLGHIHENKTFFSFLFSFFCNILEKTKYFNIGFVSL
jgi:hypothetical protein